jgi:hypothetical protein
MQPLKHFKILLVLLIVATTSAYGQIEPQWYVKDGIGRSQGGYPENQVVGSSLTVNNFPPPNVLCDSRARDDFFAIFDNGTYYLDRGDSTYRYVSNTLSLQAEDNFRILYLSATNPYDEDPPDALVSVSSPSVSGGNPIFASPNKTILSANHNVVPGKDITLIINNAKIDKGTYVLRLNKIVYTSSISDAAESGTVSSLFAPSPLFGGNFATTNTSVEGTGEQAIDSIILDINKNRPYTYINLRSSDVLESLIVNENEGAPNQVQFELYDAKNDAIIATWSEEIRGIFDPNEIVPIKVCSKEDQAPRTKYSCSFQNNNNASAGNLVVDIPSLVQASEVKIVSFSIDDTVMPIAKITPINDTSGSLRFVFDTTITIRPCETSGKPGKVIFEFCMPEEVGRRLDNSTTEMSHAGMMSSFKLDYNEPRCRLSNKKSEVTLASYMKDCSLWTQPVTCNECFDEELEIVNWLLKYWWVFLVIFMAGLSVNWWKSKN